MGRLEGLRQEETPSLAKAQFFGSVVWQFAQQSVEETALQQRGLSCRWLPADLVSEAPINEP